jgi:hypothetical protein
VHGLSTGGWGAAELGTGGWGHSELEAGSQIPSMRREREERFKGKEQGAGCMCKARTGCIAVYPDARSGGCNIEGGVHVCHSKLDGDRLRRRPDACHAQRKTIH